MNFSYRHLLPEQFSPNSRVWVYQSSRLFTLSESLNMEPQLEQFAQQWQSHGDEVTAYANLFFGQFLILIADESETKVSGCSTDASVRFVKDLGNRFQVDFFDRTTLAFIVKEKIQLLPMNQLAYAAENGFITPDTLYFNNLVATKEQLENNWIIPVKDSWLAARLPVRTT